MILGVPAERFRGERRVALVPEKHSQCDTAENRFYPRGATMGRERGDGARHPFEKAVPLFWNELDNAGMRRGLVYFDGETLAARVVLQFSPGSIEGVANGNIDIFVRGVLAGLVTLMQFIL